MQLELYKRHGFNIFTPVCNCNEKDVGIGLCKFTIISSLACLHTFWHAIPTFLYIFTVVVFLSFVSVLFFDVNLSDRPKPKNYSSETTTPGIYSLITL